MSSSLPHSSDLHSSSLHSSEGAAADHLESEACALLATLQTLRQTVDREGQEMFAHWQPQIQRSEFAASALNLAFYLALRRQDLRPLQAELMPWGLSSLGRIESRVMPNLDAVIATLSALCPSSQERLPRPRLGDFFQGDRLLQQRTAELFGSAPTQRRVHIMVTLPTQAATDGEWVQALLHQGVTCMRINCAHDTVLEWQSMLHHIRAAEQATGRSCKVLMDLGGPKPRTGEIRALGSNRVQKGDRILLTRRAGTPETSTPATSTPATSTPANLAAAGAANGDGKTWVQTDCSIPEILDQLQVGAAVWIDDGKIGTTVIQVDYQPTATAESGVLLQVTQVKPEGVKLKLGKGLNFPDTALELSPLTPKDLQDLDFVATHADIIGYSFVQTAADIQLLQQEVAKRLAETPAQSAVQAPVQTSGAGVEWPCRQTPPAIVAKIETPLAVRHLPELIVQAAGQQPFGVMIARGDLAIEIGYQRLAEIQEEILWICEAAHIPVIWATQVLESLIKTGVPSRSEMTDAAMAERAECVMLNKGEFVGEAVSILDDVLTRMQAHQSKKTPQLRALQSW